MKALGSRAFFITIIMGNLFDKTDKDEIINRIDELHPNSKPMWGKMSVSQMLAHCVHPVNVALGELKPKRNLFGVLFGKTAKKKLMSEKPFPKNLPTDKNFLVKNEPDFYASQHALKDVIQKFFDSDKNEIAARPHPFFGKMTIDEWGVLGYKHLDHHLKQFDV